MKTLVLVEASGKIDLLGKRLRELGIVAEVLATVGHIADNPKSLRPIALDGALRETAYGLRDDRLALLQKIRDAAARADRIYLAMDDDQEGDVIAHDLSVALASERPKMSRVRLRALGEQELKEAFDNAAPGDLVAAGHHGKCRRIVDRAIGSALSVLTEGAVIPVGRVQSSLLDAIERQPPQVGTMRMSMRASDGRVFVAEAGVRSRADLEALEAVAQAVAAGGGKLLGQQDERVSLGAPWPYEEAVAQIALRLRLDIEAADAALQAAYEKGLVGYPRARAQAFTPEAVELGAFLAQQNRCAFNPDVVPVRARGGERGLPHESPRPLEGDILLGRPLNLMDAAEAVQVVLARNLIECGQQVSRSRLRVEVEGRELDFCYTARPPMRSWKDRPPQDGYRATPQDVALLRYTREVGLGRPSTAVSHVRKILERNVLDCAPHGMVLSDKGRLWLQHARDAGLRADTSARMEARFDAPIDDPHATARELLREHGLLARVEQAIARQPVPKRQEHAPEWGLG